MKRVAWIVTGLLLLAGCGGSDGADGPLGEELFNEPVIGSHGGCVTCHVVNEDRVLVGPSLMGIATRAGEREAGVPAEDYIRESIKTPDAFVVEGFGGGIMPEFDLSDAQVNSLVDYLMTLK